MEVNQTIPSLVNGVSQQAPELRHDTSVDEMINCTLSMTEGTRRRNNLDWIKADPALEGHTPFIHTYERGDGTEAYIIVLIDDKWRVYDLEGNLQDDGTDSYLNIGTTAKASESFSVVTVGDTTFVVNKTKTVTESGTNTWGTSNTDYHKGNAYYWVKRTYIAYSGSTLSDVTTYSYTINSTTNSNADTENGAKSNKVAEALATSISGSSSGSIVYKATTGAWNTSDSWGDQASSGWKGVIKKLQDLPNDMGTFTGINTLVNVTGDERNKFEGFWAYHTTDGSWAETAAPGISNGFDATTMPHILTRDAATGGTGTAPAFDFTFAEYGWYERDKGDDNSNSMPSFVGNKIEDVFFHHNRLGFISEENVVFSETGVYENFFRTTVTDILPTDTIDVAVDTNQVAKLKYAIPFNQNLLLFGTHAQYQLNSAESLTPTTASVSQTTSYTINKHITPKNLGPNVYFAVDKGDFTQVREYFNVPNSTTNEALDITSHCPTYIPNDLIALEVSTKYSMLFALPEGGNTIYVYNQAWEGEQKTQSAWHKWVLDTSYTIFNIKVVGDSLMVMYDNATDRNLGSISLSSTSYLSTTFDDASSITLNEWGFSAGGEHPVDTKVGRLQIRKIELSARDGSNQDIEVNIGDTTRTAEDALASLVLGEAKKTSINIKNNGTNGFCLDSMNISGRYNPKSKSI